MPELVHYEIRDQVAVVTVDNPPVNALSPGVPEAIEAAVARARAGSRGARRGADRRGQHLHRRRGHPLLRDHHHARGFARTVACRSRAPAPHRGLPQAAGRRHPWHRARRRPRIRHGVPLPRRRRRPPKSDSPKCCSALSPARAARSACRASRARPWRSRCVRSASTSPPPRALAEGMIDRIIEGDLLAGRHRVRSRKGAIRRHSQIARAERETRRPRRGARGLRASPRTALKKTARGARAPYAAVDAIQAGIEHGFDAGSEREIEIFADCVLSTESRAMVKLFFAEREIAKISGCPQGHAHSRNPLRRRRRRGNHGRRHRHELRQRRHSGAARRRSRRKRSIAASRPFAAITQSSVAKGKMTAEQMRAHHAL